MSPLRWRTGAAGRMAIASLPIMRMNWRRRRANSLRSIGVVCSVQPLLRRIDLLAQRQQFFEHDLGRDPDELHQFRIGLFVGLVGVRVIAGGARDLGEVAHDFTDIAVQGLEVGDMSGPQAIEKSGAP